MTLMPVSRMPCAGRVSDKRGGGASSSRNSSARQRRPAVQRLAESIEQPAEALDGYRHPQRPAAVEHRRAAPQARGAIQGDGAHLVRVEMVQHLEHRTAAVDGYRERPMQRRQRLAGDVHHRPVYLNHMADGPERASAAPTALTPDTCSSACISRRD